MSSPTDRTRGRGCPVPEHERRSCTAVTVLRCVAEYDLAGAIIAYQLEVILTRDFEAKINMTADDNTTNTETIPIKPKVYICGVCNVVSRSSLVGRRGGPSLSVRRCVRVAFRFYSLLRAGARQLRKSSQLRISLCMAPARILSISNQKSSTTGNDVKQQTRPNCNVSNPNKRYIRRAITPTWPLSDIYWQHKTRLRQAVEIVLPGNEQMVGSETSYRQRGHVGDSRACSHALLASHH